jgi:signal transduction histidine kinase
MISKASSECDIREAENRILFLFESRLEQVIQDEVALLESVSRNLHKLSPNVVFANDRFIIPDDLKPLMRKVFVHLLRNSIDHGIEREDERVAKGKSPRGEISV